MALQRGARRGWGRGACGVPPGGLRRGPDAVLSRGPDRARAPDQHEHQHRTCLLAAPARLQFSAITLDPCTKFSPHYQPDTQEALFVTGGAPGGGRAWRVGGRVGVRRAPLAAAAMQAWDPALEAAPCPQRLQPRPRRRARWADLLVACPTPAPQAT